MNSLNCESILKQLVQNQSKHEKIIKEAQKYQQCFQSEQEINSKDSIGQQLMYQGFENKKSLKIKPINMFKDIIALRKQNDDKRLQVHNLQSINEALRNQYEQCMNQNLKLQAFLKEVEFTFQPDPKMNQANDVLLRARRNLFLQSRETKERLKKMFRNSDASTVQQIKAYISTLQSQKQRLKYKIMFKKQQVNQRVKEQDFNVVQTKKYQLVCEKVKDILTNEVQKTKKRAQAYKIQKMQMKQQLKINLLESKRRIVKNQAEGVKKLLLETQGLEYQIDLLKHRLKDRKKQIGEYEALLQKISLKQGTILKLQRQLREKNKTFDYMLAWTKQLKKQLEDRKSDHVKKKAIYEQQINLLSENYQKYNQIYKAGLFEEQVAKRRGPRDPDPPNVIRTHTLGKQITIQEIKSAVKSLSFFLLENNIETETFVQNILKISLSTAPKDSKKPQIHSSVALSDKNLPNKGMISLQQLTANLQAVSFLQNRRQQILKIARFIIEDGSSKAQDSTGVFIEYARQIIKNLLKRQLTQNQSILEAEQGLKKLIKNSSQPLRQQLKVFGGCEQQIEIDTLKLILPKYGIEPYLANLIAQYFQFCSWKKRKQTGYAKLQDYDQLVRKFSKKQDDI